MSDEHWLGMFYMMSDDDDELCLRMCHIMSEEQWLRLLQLMSAEHWLGYLYIMSEEHWLGLFYVRLLSAEN